MRRIAASRSKSRTGAKGLCDQWSVIRLTIGADIKRQGQPAGTSRGGRRSFQATLVPLSPEVRNAAFEHVANRLEPVLADPTPGGVPVARRSPG
jgi:hypothetical protein